MEKLEESYRMGQLALQILKKFPSKQLEARVMHLYWAFVGSSREPLTSVLNSQVEAHHLALRHGDTEVR